MGRHTAMQRSAEMLIYRYLFIYLLVREPGTEWKHDRLFLFSPEAAAAALCCISCMCYFPNNVWIHLTVNNNNHDFTFYTQIQGKKQNKAKCQD